MSAKAVDSASHGMLGHLSRLVHSLGVPEHALRELARPWHIVLEQLALMAEPLCTPDERARLASRTAALTGALDADAAPRAETREGGAA